MLTIYEASAFYCQITSAVLGADEVQRGEAASIEEASAMVLGLMAQPSFDTDHWFVARDKDSKVVTLRLVEAHADDFIPAPGDFPTADEFIPF